MPADSFLRIYFAAILLSSVIHFLFWPCKIVLAADFVTKSLFEPDNSPVIKFPPGRVLGENWRRFRRELCM